MKRTWEDINRKIDDGTVVVITAEEMTELVKEKGVSEAYKRIDVVTTGTFGTMCSSGLLLNTGHQSPRINYKKASLNGVPAYAGIAAVDLYVGATSISEDEEYQSKYGGGHVIEDLLAGKEVELVADGHGTDCYPGKHLSKTLKLEDLKDAVIYNPRNAYQNYNVAVNATSDETIHTYMGALFPKMQNVSYSSAGELSPLLNDPEYRTIGIGSRIFLGGGVGYVSFKGTQHNPDAARTENGVPREGAGTLSLTGNLRGMSTEYLRGVYIAGYGVSLSVGIGVPIPMLDEEMVRFTSVSNKDIKAPVVDYSKDYPELTGNTVAETDYHELRTGTINIGGKSVKTVPLSSLPKARKIANELKDWISKGEFKLTKPVAAL